VWLGDVPFVRQFVDSGVLGWSFDQGAMWGIDSSSLWLQQCCYFFCVILLLLLLHSNCTMLLIVCWFVVELLWASCCCFWCSFVALLGSFHVCIEIFECTVLYLAGIVEIFKKINSIRKSNGIVEYKIKTVMGWLRSFLRVVPCLSIWPLLSSCERYSGCRSQ